MMSMPVNEDKQSGLVSIFSVIFFMILMSVIVVGFIKIVGDESRQTTDNDLTASALISAQSGAEEAKRILLFCKRTDLSAGETSACAAGLNQTNCKAAMQAFGPLGRLGLNVGTDDEGVVTTNDNYQQRFTCLSIQTQTPSVSDINVPLLQSELIPLNSASAFNRVVFSWHNPATDKDGTAALGVAQPTLSQPNWNALNRPAMMRLEFVPYPKSGAINLAALEQQTRTVFLTPSGTSGAVNATLVSLDNRQDNPNARPTSSNAVSASCDVNRAYLCSATISIDGMQPTTSHNYMLRVTSYYRGTHVDLGLLAASGTAVNFDNVQPTIDVTGRANDVFRRVQTKVSYSSNFFSPAFALGSASSICKDMVVTSDADGQSRDNCSPAGLSVPPPAGSTGEAAVALPGDSAAPPSDDTGGPTPLKCWEENGGWFTASCWDVRLTNTSVNPPNSIATCIWNFGDGVVDTYPGTHANCQQGTVVPHQYTPVGPEGVYREYSFSLTNRMNDGNVYTYSRTIKRPY